MRHASCVMRHASRGCCFRAGMDAPSRSRDAQPERSHSGNARTAQREHLLSRSPAHPARIRMAVCRRKVPASATRHSLLPPGEGAPKGRMRVRPHPHRSSRRLHTPHDSQRAAQSATAPSPSAPLATYRRTRQSTADIAHRVFLAHFSIAPIRGKAPTQGCAISPGYFLQTAVIGASRFKTASIKFSIATREIVMNHHD